MSDMGNISGTSGLSRMGDLLGMGGVNGVIDLLGVGRMGGLSRMGSISGSSSMGGMIGVSGLSGMGGSSRASGISSASGMKGAGKYESKLSYPEFCAKTRSGMAIGMTNCLIAGIGGQGTILAARLIGGAAMAAGLSVRGSETIGMAQRGSGVVSHVRMGGAIFSPLIPLGEADVLIAFEPGEAVSAARFLAPGGVAVVCDRPVMPSDTTSAGAAGGSIGARAAGGTSAAGGARSIGGASAADGARLAGAAGGAGSTGGMAAADAADALGAGADAAGNTRAAGAAGGSAVAGTAAPAYSPSACISWLRENIKTLRLADGDALIGQIGARCLNVALIGMALSLGAFPFSAGDMEDAIRQRVPERYAEMNMGALRIGMEWR
jgi:indolepyruvate ferredoxin oxidoreductase beta subunit